MPRSPCSSFRTMRASETVGPVLIECSFFRGILEVKPRSRRALARAAPSRIVSCGCILRLPRTLDRTDFPDGAIRIRTRRLVSGAVLQRGARHRRVPRTHRSRTRGDEGVVRGDLRERREPRQDGGDARRNLRGRQEIQGSSLLAQFRSPGCSHRRNPAREGKVRDSYRR